jgi:uncharacterized FlgJ-related protein
MALNYDQEIYDGAIKGGAKPSLATLLVAQARHETGNYSNKQTKVNNNLFGFKYSPNSKFSKKGNISPEGDPYAKFDTVGDAIQEYVIRWMGKNAKNGGTRLQEFNAIQPNDTTTYANKLKGYGYYGAAVSEYIRGLNSALTRIKVVAFYNQNKMAVNSTLGIGILLIAIASYIYIKKNK